MTREQRFIRLYWLRGFRGFGLELDGLCISMSKTYNGQCLALNAAVRDLKRAILQKILNI